MTAFAILGSSGLAYHRGIGVFGLMASSSALVIPLTHLLHRHAAVGAWEKVRPHDAGAVFSRPLGMLRHRHGDLRAHDVMLVPYIIIGVMGGGQTLEAVSTTIGPDGEPRAFFSYEWAARSWRWS